MATVERYALGVLTTSLLLLTACGVRPMVDRAPAPSDSAPPLPPDAIPRAEPRSRYGNTPVYEVLGERYEVMTSANGYRERGVASWYGEKFHGKLTASREPYDMYAMTAAHKSLPIPTYVEVRNLSNDRRIVVRINDRGPFVHNRIIDLSYAAALKLDMVRDGTSLVEVTAIQVGGPTSPSSGTKTTASAPRATTSSNKPTLYVQVGAFGDRDNALRRQRILTGGGIPNTVVHHDPQDPRGLYRVRVGPIADVAGYDQVVAELDRLGINETHLVSE